MNEHRGPQGSFFMHSVCLPTSAAACTTPNKSDHKGGQIWHVQLAQRTSQARSNRARRQELRSRQFRASATTVVAITLDTTARDIAQIGAACWRTSGLRRMGAGTGPAISESLGAAA